MNEIQIKRAKRLAEILGLDFNVEIYGVFVSTFSANYNSHESKQFKPEQDKALLWDLMNEYKVAIVHDFSYVISDFGPSRHHYVDESGLPVALIDCVIEINGGYDE